ncbi:Protein of unknown function [Gryllus bimaculatus]|nr:Protein of unknown function [Gryllus bimaculatus]
MFAKNGVALLLIAFVAAEAILRQGASEHGGTTQSREDKDATTFVVDRSDDADALEYSIPEFEEPFREHNAPTEDNVSGEQTATEINGHARTSANSDLSDQIQGRSAGGYAAQPAVTDHRNAHGPPPMLPERARLSARSNAHAPLPAEGESPGFALSGSAVVTDGHGKGGGVDLPERYVAPLNPACVGDVRPGFHEAADCEDYGDWAAPEGEGDGPGEEELEAR